MSVVWFPGIGFRPAIWASHRHDDVDPQRPQIAPDADVAYLAKWDGPALTHPLTNAGWVLDPLPITPHALATPGGIGPTHTAPPLIGGWLPCCTIGRPDHPGTPGVTQPEPLPPIAPVPVPASAGFLIVALVMVAAIKRKAR